MTEIMKGTGPARCLQAADHSVFSTLLYGLDFKDLTHCRANAPAQRFKSRTAATQSDRQDIVFQPFTEVDLAFRCFSGCFAVTHGRGVDSSYILDMLVGQSLLILTKT